MKAKRLLLALAAVLICGLDSNDARRGPSARETFNVRLQEIGQELKTLGPHPWAGDYSIPGSHSNIIFAIAPKSGFVYKSEGCLGVYDLNYGPVTPAADRLVLDFAHKGMADNYFPMGEQLLRVPWGERLYLVPPDWMVRFCNAVNTGQESYDRCGGFFLLRGFGRTTKVKGLPEVPDEYRRYLLEEPIRATITVTTDPEPSKDNRTSDMVTMSVSLDVGRDSGLLEGMTLHAAEPRKFSREFTVTSVDPTFTIASVVFYPTEAQPEPGWQLSTRKPDATYSLP